MAAMLAGKPMSRSFYGELYRATTYPLLSLEETEREAAFLVEVLGLVPGQRVLDVACGQGRHLCELERRGLGPLVGFDLDRVALRAATGAKACADLRSLPFRQVFDAAYAWYSSLFVFDEEGNRRVVAELARCLRPGGVLLMHSLNPALLAAAPVQSASLTLPDGSRVEELSRYLPEENRDEGLRRWITPSGRTLCGKYSIRYYSLPELGRLCESAGLSIERACDGRRGEAFTSGSRELVVLARRR